MRNIDSWADAFRKDADEIPPPPPRARAASPRLELAQAPQDPEPAVTPPVADPVAAPTARHTPAPVAPGGPDTGDGTRVRALFRGDDIDAALQATPRHPATPTPPAPAAAAPAHSVSAPADPATAEAADADVRVPTQEQASRVTIADAPSGQRVTAAQLRARRAATRHAEKIAEALSGSGIEVVIRNAELSGGTVGVTLACPAALSDTMLDAVAEAFGDSDVEVELGDDWVRLWVEIEDSEPAKQRAIWVPAALRERVRLHTERTGESVSQLALRAFNSQHDQLEGLFNVDDASEGPLRVSTSKRRSGVETPVQLWMYWRRSHTDEIDAAVRATGAGSRSALLTVVLERYLDSIGG